MRVIRTVVLLLVAAFVINVIREGADYPLPQTLPLLGGHEPSAIYDGLGGAGLLLLLVWGLHRLGQRK